MEFSWGLFGALFVLGLIRMRRDGKLTWKALRLWVYRRVEA